MRLTWSKANPIAWTDWNDIEIKTNSNMKWNEEGKTKELEEKTKRTTDVS